jgi:hypothetical protein
MLTNTIVANTSVQTPTVNTSVVNTGSVVASGDVSGATLTGPIQRATTIQGIGAGTPQATQIRVATVGDPAQKVTNVWATNIGNPANKTNSITASAASIDTLTVSGSQIFANAGIQMNGYVFNNWYREDPFSMTLSSGFMNTTSSVSAITQGMQGMFKLHTKEFIVYSYEQSGSDDALYLDVPYLQSYQMSGYIQFATSNDPGAYNLAIAFKDAGNSQIIIAPLNNRHFTNGTYSGQDLYFKHGFIFCSEF